MALATFHRSAHYLKYTTSIDLIDQAAVSRPQSTGSRWAKMPWVYVGSDAMIDFNVEMAKKIEVSIKFQILKPNSVLTMKMLMRLPRMVMFFPCVPTSHLPTNRL